MGFAETCQWDSQAEGGQRQDAGPGVLLDRKEAKPLSLDYATWWLFISLFIILKIRCELHGHKTVK